ncbi:hypothetical protein QJQ45_019930 [Haematococcus lacustris]|nr:hypothetical protein QJQ45_019930 [Haematococcus lacustris]
MHATEPCAAPQLDEGGAEVQGVPLQQQQEGEEQEQEQDQQQCQGDDQQDHQEQGLDQGQGQGPGNPAAPSPGTQSTQQAFKQQLLAAKSSSVPLACDLEGLWEATRRRAAAAADRLTLTPGATLAVDQAGSITEEGAGARGGAGTGTEAGAGAEGVGGVAAVDELVPPSAGSAEVAAAPRAAKRVRRSRFQSASLLGGSESEQQQQLAAEAELERVFNKQDFRRMVVVGQFNLGFILARLDQDVFIVDQHAADEKATFERLQARLVLNKQPLLLPKDLQLGPLDQAILRDHVEAFRRNGFEFVEPKAYSGPAAQQPLEINQGLEEQPGDGGGAEGHDGAGGAGGGGGTLAVQRPLHDQRPHWQQGLLLAAVPYSKGIVFGPDDVCEMVGLIKAGVRPEDVQPSRQGAEHAGFAGLPILYHDRHRPGSACDALRAG